MPFDYSGNPLAQAFISEGQARGYNPYAIAAILGNSQQENNLQPGGRPGDSGASFGGMQWNNDRLANLRSFAQQQGTSWDDPTTQAKFYYNELDGPEKQWGTALRNATNINDATDAAISTLRPRGWTADNPQAGDAYDRRLQYAQNAYSALGNGDSGIGGTGSPTGNMLAYAGASDANNDPGTSAIANTFGKPGSQAAQPAPAAPALDRDTAAISVPGFDGTFTRAQAAAASDDDDKTPGTDDWDKAFDAMPKNAQGQAVAPSGSTPASTGGALSTDNAIGPGILNWLNSDKSTNFGNSLTRLGAALMARDNPSGSSALLSTLPNPNQALNAQYTQAQINHLKSLDSSDDTKDLTSVHWVKLPNGQMQAITTNKQGQAIDPATGKPSTTGIVGQPDPNSGHKPIAPKLQSDFAQADLSFRDGMTALDKLDDVTNRLIDAPETSLNAFSRGGQILRLNTSGEVTPNDVLIKDADTELNRVILSGLKAKFGSRVTNFDVAYARKSYLPDSGQLSKTVMLEAIQRAREDAVNNLNAGADANMNRIQNEPRLDDAKGSRAALYIDNQKRINDNANTMSGKLTDYLKKQYAQPQAGAAKPGGAYQPGSLHSAVLGQKPPIQGPPMPPEPPANPVVGATIPPM